VMPNITRGDRMGGLLVYLAGPGRANEHVEPHLVAGDSAVMAWHSEAVLDRAAALDVARQLDHPRRAFGVEVAGGSVWHCSLSLRAEEGLLTDQQWSQVAHEFVERMGFGDAAGKAACRWVAVRHGVSTAGNDHVHLAVSLVREDGTKASTWNDRPRAQQVAGELELTHGLQVLESRQAGRGDRGVKPAEVATAAARGTEVARTALARTVRGCAAAAADEGEFVRRVRRAGVLVRPRYAAGRDDVVVGFSAAHRPPAGQPVIWYGGGHLARDLTLPRLRVGWPDDPQTAAQAAAEWRAGQRQQRPVAPGRELTEPDPALWAQHTAEVSALRDRLRAVPPGDRATWAHVARETAGAFAAWSVRVEATPGPLAATADALARSAQLRAHAVRPRPAGLPSARGAALLLASVAHGGTGTVAQAVLLRQLANTAKALHDAHVAVGEARRAAEIATVIRSQLATVRAALPPVPAAGVAASPVDSETAQAARLVRAGQPPLRAPGSPVPTDLQGRPARSTAGPNRDQGLDR